MSDTFKGMLFCFIVFIVWSASCFFAGYILSNSRATEQLNKANRELAEQQQRYDDLIREAEERLQQTNDRLRDIREQLSAKVSDNGKATEELSGIIEQIRKQKLNIKV